eukprot:Colp12_sorted_trinity150504_noHs@34697
MDQGAANKKPWLLKKYQKMAHDQIYMRRADKYHELTLRQDYHNNLAGVVKGIKEFAPSTTVVELGCGTGRLTKLVAPLVDCIHAFDNSELMLEYAKQYVGSPRVTYGLGDNRTLALPLETNSCDVVLAGWCLSYLKSERFDSNWKDSVDAVFRECKRVLRPHGAVVIFETLGTGCEEPKRLGSHYYQYLLDLGFKFCHFRTDYKFASKDEAEELVTIFFGEKMLQNVRESEGGLVLPECTGLWILSDVAVAPSPFSI